MAYGKEFKKLVKFIKSYSVGDHIKRQDVIDSVGSPSTTSGYLTVLIKTGTIEKVHPGIYKLKRIIEVENGKLVKPVMGFWGILDSGIEIFLEERK